MLTPYHAKYFAHELTKRCPSNSLEKLTSSLADAQVDLNPHQIEAALFAFKSPFSQGAILADEVGLGKTIEAGIILSQLWAEQKRKLLIIAPASLRKQWCQELAEKFFLPSVILEKKSFDAYLKQGAANPFEQDAIVVCSYQFARNQELAIRTVNWDVVVIDEAHKLRNVYRKDSKIAQAIKDNLAHARKLLLTATPLQNSLLELYGLVSFIDDYTFGDLKSFRHQFTRITSQAVFDDLKMRLKPHCHRTLRSQVLEYIRYTNRIPITQEFLPTPDEQRLYELVSDYLRQPELQALPSGQRTLMTLVMRKLLASSTFAIAGALHSLKTRLEGMLEASQPPPSPPLFVEDYAPYDSTDEEWEEPDLQVLPKEQREKIEAEIQELDSYHKLATSITENAKGIALVDALKAGFSKAHELGGADKALIFTESKRTQDYLFNLLSKSGYEGQIVTFNGTNNEPLSKTIYAEWLTRHEKSDIISGSKVSDMRAALVEQFRDHARIMIATEAAAEGLNLQFCSLLVNYDLPWNPQRVEQRIGRCHRYGQIFDVVVVNFLNKGNAADQRVFQLLSEKFALFDGVFGASDEVLGSLESGVDVEKRISKIYQECRTSEEIEASFEALREELDSEIKTTMRDTRNKLFENFDEEVHEKLRINLTESQEHLSRYEEWLWKLTRFVLNGHADFAPEGFSFKLKSLPSGVSNIPLGLYRMGRRVEDAHIFRLNHPLARWIIQQAHAGETPGAEIRFDYSGTDKCIAALEPLVGSSGSLMVRRMTIESVETEDYIIFGALTDRGEELDDNQAHRLFNLPGELAEALIEVSPDTLAILERKKGEILSEITDRNAMYFDEEMDKLDKWAEDRKTALELKIKETDAQIGVLKAEARKTAALEEKVHLRRQMKELEKKRTDMRKKLFDAQDEIDGQKETLLDSIEARMQQSIDEIELFSIRWTLI